MMRNNYFELTYSIEYRVNWKVGEIMSSKRNLRNPLSNEELLEMIESGLSDIEFLSDEDGDDGWHEELSEGEDIFDVGNDEEVVEDFPQDESTPRIHEEPNIYPSTIAIQLSTSK
ncbi:hypothetical protein JTB14_027974 [Gonioctena quinquepunctata]|nr:hypothetical protein JTB14_027974 [Gonioctena quinquepunctata]